MKCVLFLALALSLSGNLVRGQCTTTKIVSPAVAEPTAASIVSSTCSTLVVKWTGNTGQSYGVSAVRYNPATNIRDTVAGSTPALISGLDYTSTIPVVAGSQVSWSVEANSLINGTTYTSYPVRGVLEYPVAACNGSGVSFSGRVLLQGPYNLATGLMSNRLNSLGILQASAANQPYNSAGFNYPGTEKASAGFFSAHTDIVDWVLIELRDPNSPSTFVARRAAFVKQDGTLCDTNGTSTQITFPNVAAGNYQVSIRHRNHLGIRSANAVDFSSGSAFYDFTSAGFKSYKNQSYTSPVQMGATWTMRGGDANANIESRYQGPGNDRAAILTDLANNQLGTLTGYYRSDLNLDGVVSYQGPGNDRAFLLATVLANSELVLFRQQLDQ